MKNSVQWVSDGTKSVPTPNYTEGLDGLPMDKFGNLDTQALREKVLGDLLPDGSSFDISDFSSVRGNKYTMNPRNGTTNFSQANQKLMESSGKKIKILEEKLGFKLTWHEESNLKTLTLLPFELHNYTILMHILVV